MIMPYEYEAPYDYPYGIYVMAKNFCKLNRQILEQTMRAVSHLEAASSKKRMLRKIRGEIEKAYGNIFEDYGWLEKSHEAEDCREYLAIQYLVAGNAVRFFGRLSPIEASLESAFLEQHLFLSKYAPIPVLYRQKTRFFENLNPLKIYLAVKYLEQLGFSKNRIRDKKLVFMIQNELERIGEGLQKRALTKEEWEKRDKAKAPVKY